jgi:hypothetical protein
MIFRHQWGYLFNDDPGSLLFVSPPRMTASSYCYRRCCHVSGIGSSNCGPFPSVQFPQWSFWRDNESPGDAGAFSYFVYSRTEIDDLCWTGYWRSIKFEVRQLIVMLFKLKRTQDDFLFSAYYMLGELSMPALKQP